MISWDFTNGDMRAKSSERRPVILNVPEFGGSGPGSVNQGPGGRGDFMSQMRGMDMMGGGGGMGHMGGDGSQRGQRGRRAPF